MPQEQEEEGVTRAVGRIGEMDERWS